MRISSLRLGVLLLGVLTAPAFAQAPPPPGAVCLCMKQSVDAANADMSAKNDALGAGGARRARSAARRRACRGQCRQSASGRPVPSAAGAAGRRGQARRRQRADRRPGGKRPLQRRGRRLQQPVRRPAVAAAAPRAAQLPDALGQNPISLVIAIRELGRSGGFASPASGPLPHRCPARSGQSRAV
jgi:hypothetical protein